MEAYQELEQKYAAFVGSRFAVSCNSGTSALHLALMALGVGKGDEVIVPDFTMAACAFAVSYCGAKPVFVDALPDTYAIDPSKIERAITKKTKAIMVVHVYGRLADMKAILRIAKKYKLPVIEDACEAQGAVYKSKADITTYSFYRNKIIHAEEGGLLTTNSKKIADRANYLKNMAFDKGHTYYHAEVGYNYRMANNQADMALKSLKNYKKNAVRRRQIETLYAKALPMPRRDAVWFYEARVPKAVKKEILKCIPAARECFKPLSTFPMYGRKKGFPVARALSESLILLPAHPELSPHEVRDIIRIVQSVWRKQS